MHYTAVSRRSLGNAKPHLYFAILPVPEPIDDSLTESSAISFTSPSCTIRPPPIEDSTRKDLPAVPCPTPPSQAERSVRHLSSLRPIFLNKGLTTTPPRSTSNTPTDEATVSEHFSGSLRGNQSKDGNGWERHTRRPLITMEGDETPSSQHSRSASTLQRWSSTEAETERVIRVYEDYVSSIGKPDRLRHLLRDLHGLASREDINRQMRRLEVFLGIPSAQLDGKHGRTLTQEEVMGFVTWSAARKRPHSGGPHPSDSLSDSQSEMSSNTHFEHIKSHYSTTNCSLISNMSEDHRKSMEETEPNDKAIEVHASAKGKSNPNPKDETMPAHVCVGHCPSRASVTIPSICVAAAATASPAKRTHTAPTRPSRLSAVQYARRAREAPPPPPYTPSARGHALERLVFAQLGGGADGSGVVRLSTLRRMLHACRIETCFEPFVGTAIDAARRGCVSFGEFLWVLEEGVRGDGPAAAMHRRMGAARGVPGGNRRAAERRGAPTRARGRREAAMARHSPYAKTNRLPETRRRAVRAASGSQREATRRGNAGTERGEEMQCAAQSMRELRQQQRRLVTRIGVLTKSPAPGKDPRQQQRRLQRAQEELNRVLDLIGATLRVMGSASETHTRK